MLLANLSAPDDRPVDIDDLPERGGIASARRPFDVTPAGDRLLAGARGGVSAIVIVRDPRDVASSLASHLRTPIDAAIAFTTLEWDGGRPARDWAAAGRPPNPGRLNAVEHIILKSADVPWRRRARPWVLPFATTC